MTGATDLPNDLLCAIYNRCYSSNVRARFAAVCKSWRATASWQAKLTALPLLLPSTGNSCLDQKARAYSPEEGRALRSRLPWFPYGKQVVGSHHGGWVAVAVGGQIEIVNLFARACWVTVKARIAGRISVAKVVFSEDPTSGGCILAAMTTGSTIAIYRLGCPGAGWMTRGCGADESFVDIAFCNGELYGLTRNDQLHGHRLYKLSIGINEYDAVAILFNELTINWPEMFNLKYIFELSGKVAAAVKVKPVGDSKARIFKVLELVAGSDTTQPFKYTWAEVTSLGDHALFLGPGCCKAVHLSGTERRGEVQRNIIYYSRPRHKLHDGVDPWFLGTLDLGSCVVYRYENKEAHQHLERRIISRGYHYSEKTNGINRNSCTWILPP